MSMPAATKIINCFNCTATGIYNGEVCRECSGKGVMEVVPVEFAPEPPSPPDRPSAENPFQIILAEQDWFRHFYASAEWIESNRWEHERGGKYDHALWEWSDAEGMIGPFRYVRVWPRSFEFSFPEN